MGSYVLVEKEAKLMKRCWKWAIIGLLASIVLACFINSYAFHALVENYNSNCVSSASLVFRPIWYRSGLPEAARRQYANSKRYEDDSYAEKVNYYYQEFKSHHLQVINASADVDATAEPKAHLYQLKSQSDDLLTTTTERYGYGLLRKKPTEMNVNDSVFFKTYQVDENNSNWGQASTCEYFNFVPIIESLIAIVCIVFICISGYRGTRSAQTLIDKAWRLVLPAAICFFILAIVSIVYAFILTDRLAGFCDEFKRKLNNTALPCTLLVDRFSLDDSTFLSPSTNFNLSRMLAWLTVVLWIMAFLVMLIRCMVGADFELEEVEHYAEGRGTTLDQQPNSATSRVKFHDDGFNYSKESAYRPAEWSGDQSGPSTTRAVVQTQVPERVNLLNNGK